MAQQQVIPAGPGQAGGGAGLEAWGPWGRPCRKGGLGDEKAPPNFREEWGATWGHYGSLQGARACVLYVSCVCMCLCLLYMCTRVCVCVHVPVCWMAPKSGWAPWMPLSPPYARWSQAAASERLGTVSAGTLGFP